MGRLGEMRTSHFWWCDCGGPVSSSPLRPGNGVIGGLGSMCQAGPRASRAVRRRTHSDIAADVPPRRRSLVSPSRASRRSTWQCAGSVPSQDLSSGDEDRPSRVTLHFAQLFLHPIHHDAFLCRLVFNFCFAIRYPGTMEDNSFSILWHVVPDSSAFSSFPTSGPASFSAAKPGPFPGRGPRIPCRIGASSTVVADCCTAGRVCLGQSRGPEAPSPTSFSGGASLEVFCRRVQFCFL